MSVLDNLWNKVSDVVSNACSTVKETVGASKGAKNAAAAVGNIPMAQNKHKEENVIRIDTGNGVIKVVNSKTNAIEGYELDYAKGYDGRPQMFAEGTKVTILNAPKPKEKSFLDKVDDTLTSVDKTVSDATRGYVKRFGHGTAGWVLTVGAAFGLAYGGPALISAGKSLAAGTAGKLALGGGVAVGMGSCAKDNVIHQEITFEEITTTKTDTIPGNPGTPDTYIPGTLTPDEWNNAKVGLLNSTIEEKNNSNPKTTDGVGYRYESNSDGTGSIIIKNKDGSDSNIKLGFNTHYNIDGETTDPVTGNYYAGLTLTATPNGTISNGNVVEYINIIGGEHKTSTNVSYAYTLSGNDVVTTYGNTGFTHKVGETAEVKADSPLGKMQTMLHELAVLPQDAGNKVAAQAFNGGGAYGQGNGIAFKVDGGDLHDITTGNPVVRLALDDMLGNTVNVHGELSVEGNVIKIVNAADNKVLTLTPQNNLVMNGSECKGVSVAYDGKEVFRMSTDTFNGKKQTVLAATGYDEYGDYGTVTYTNFPANTPNLFDGKTATTESDEYFNEKKTNLTNAYQTAVDEIYKQAKLEKNGTEIPGTPGTNYTVQITIHTKSDGEVTVKTN